MVQWLIYFYTFRELIRQALGLTSSAASVQQYFKYTYQSTLYVVGDSGTYPAAGFIRFNTADTSAATEAAVANLTNTTPGQGIGNYMSTMNAGCYMHVRSTLENKLGIYKIESVPETIAGARRITVTVVNGLALTDGDEVTISFTSNANCVWDATNETITANGVSVAPNAYTTDTIAEAISNVAISAANDGKVFAVRDPGGNAANPLVKPLGWLLQVDNTAAELVQMSAPCRFFTLRNPIRCTVPAASLTYTVSNNGGKVRLTNASHGITLLAGTFTYLPIKTTANGWTANTLVKVTATSGTTIDLDTDFASQGNPTFYAIGEKFPMLAVNVPALRSWSSLVGLTQWSVSNSAGIKDLTITYGTAFDIYDPANLTTTNGSNRSFGFTNQGKVTGTDAQFSGSPKASGSDSDGLVAGSRITGSENSGIVQPLTFYGQTGVVNEYVELSVCWAGIAW